MQLRKVVASEGSIKTGCGKSGLNYDSLWQVRVQLRKVVASQGSIKTFCGKSKLN